jgi:hypothetical protein
MGVRALRTEGLAFIRRAGRSEGGQAWAVAGGKTCPAMGMAENADEEMSDKELMDAWIRRQKRRDPWQLARGISLESAFVVGLYLPLKWLDEKREIRGRDETHSESSLASYTG